MGRTKITLAARPHLRFPIPGRRLTRSMTAAGRPPISLPPPRGGCDVSLELSTSASESSSGIVELPLEAHECSREDLSGGHLSSDPISRSRASSSSRRDARSEAMPASWCTLGGWSLPDSSREDEDDA